MPDGLNEALSEVTWEAVTPFNPPLTGKDWTIMDDKAFHQIERDLHIKAGVENELDHAEQRSRVFLPAIWTCATAVTESGLPGL